MIENLFRQVLQIQHHHLAMNLMMLPLITIIKIAFVVRSKIIIFVLVFVLYPESINCVCKKLFVGNIQEYCKNELQIVWQLIYDSLQLNQHFMTSKLSLEILHVATEMVNKSGQLKHHICRNTYKFDENMEHVEVLNTSRELGETFVTMMCTLGGAVDLLPDDEQIKLREKFQMFFKICEEFQPTFEQLQFQ